MKKTYLTLKADVLEMLDQDILTTSDGTDHGMGDGVTPDQDWQVGAGEPVL